MREIAGWLLVLLGLFIFYLCITLVTQPEPYLFEAGQIVIIGIFIFRGGIHLLKVAVAARICLHAQKPAEGDHAPAPPAVRSGRAAIRPSSARRG
jgi:hypothetical protein